jgi:hypothetical protein
MEEDEGISTKSVRASEAHLRETCKNLCVVQNMYSHCSFHFIRFYVSRSLIQIKSHAQKVLKRIESGENVFRRLEENSSHTDALVAKIHADLGMTFGKGDETKTTTTCSSFSNAVPPLLGLVVVVDKNKKKKQQSVKNREQQKKQKYPKHPLPAQSETKQQPIRKRQRSEVDYSYIVAASALCELSRPAASVAATATATPTNSSSSNSSSSDNSISSSTKLPPAATHDFHLAL